MASKPSAGLASSNLIVNPPTDDGLPKRVCTLRRKSLEKRGAWRPNIWHPIKREKESFTAWFPRISRLAMANRTCYDDMSLSDILHEAMKLFAWPQ